MGEKSFEINWIRTKVNDWKEAKTSVAALVTYLHIDLYKMSRTSFKGVCYAREICLNFWKIRQEVDFAASSLEVKST